MAEYAKDAIDRIQQIKPSDVTSSIAKAGESVTSYAAAAQENVVGELNKFASNVNMTSAGQDFLNSNSIIAKFVFVILTLIVFMFLLNLGISLIGYFTQSSSSPYIVPGMLPGNSNLVIPQDPALSNGVNILRSNNQSTGLEYTWSTWLNITGFQNPSSMAGSPSTIYNNIFNKGGAFYNGSGLAKYGNSPGVYISKDSSNNMNLHIYTDTATYDSPDSSSNPLGTATIVTGIPVNKWFHVAIRMQNKVMDVYVNGVVSARTILPSVPIQNYYNINVGTNGGFTGNISNLQYYNYALTSFSINNIVMGGPNLTTSPLSPSGGTSNQGQSAYYLSNLWYTSKIAPIE